jgi:hypothetical protein
MRIPNLVGICRIFGCRYDKGSLQKNSKLDLLLQPQARIVSLMTLRFLVLDLRGISEL